MDQRMNTLSIATSIALVGAAANSSLAQRLDLVTEYPNGTQTDDQSREPSISEDGRYICFESRDSLVPADTNHYWDIYVKDIVSGEIKLCSQTTNGVVGNSFSTMAQISGDGSIVCFMSTANNLVPNDTNDQWDYFVHDLTTRETTRISVSSTGEQANGGADCGCRVYKYPTVSYDGNLIAFQTNASNLAPNDNNELFDIYQRNRAAGTTVRVSVAMGNGDTNGSSFVRNGSPDGRFIVFYSTADNIVPNDTNGVRDIFIRDMQNGTIERCSIRTDGGQTNDISEAPDVSADGRYVAFASLASNLVPNDLNGVWDVFLRDRVLGTTVRISERTDGVEGNGYSRHPSISDDGRWITFHSLATNFLRGDTNNWRDTLLHDMVTGETTYVSAGPDGIGDKPSLDAFISGNGQWIVFDSVASNLVPADLNNNRDVFRSERFGQQLTLVGPAPGETNGINRWEVTGLGAGAGVILVFDFRSGSSPVVSCPMVHLSLAQPKMVGGAYADNRGRATIKRFVQSGASGRTIRCQAYSQTNCTISNVVTFTFP